MFHKFFVKLLIALAILLLLLIGFFYTPISRSEEASCRKGIDSLTERLLTEIRKVRESVQLEKGQRIPKIIHQSWKTKTLPTKFQQWSDSWSLKNPTYSRKLWTDEENRALIAEHYPWFLEKFDSFPQNIHRIDVSRIFYMHKYGGIYSDLDVVCLKPVNKKKYIYISNLFFLF